MTKDDNVTEFFAHKGRPAKEMMPGLLFDPSLSTLGVLERNVEIMLKIRAEYREKVGSGIDDGIEERALLVRGILAEVREDIRRNDAAAAANDAARAAYLIGELDTAFLDGDGLKAVKESIRLAAKEQP